ncbi:MAG: PEP-CTERM sorting domain-containing protein [Methylophilaceae bacterium]
MMNISKKLNNSKSTITFVGQSAALILLGVISSAAAAKTELGTVGAGYTYQNTYNYNQSDYVSEENIASDTIYFSLTSEQSVKFFADSFNFTNPSVSEFRQIDILDVDKTIAGQHGNNYIGGIGDYYQGLNGGPSSFNWTLGPGNYQINYKSTGLEQNYTAGRVVGTAVNGLGDYRLGLIVGDASAVTPPTGPVILPNVPAVPEPETYAMLLAGLSLIGFTARRRKTA